MSTSRVVRTLSDSASFSLSSLSSLRFAVEGGRKSKFTVTDTRKCSKTCKFSSSPKRRDSELPLPPPTKPKVRSVAAVQAVYDWETSQPNSNQAEGAEQNTASLFEICDQEEAEEDPGRKLSKVITAQSSVESTSATSGTYFFGISATQSSMSSSQLLLRGFRQDLDEEVQMRIIEEYRKKRHAAWVRLHPTANSKYSEVNKWPKRQQAMGLALLVVEAHIHMRKLRAVKRTPVTAPVCLTDSMRTCAQPPPASQTSTVDITNARNVAMVLHDVFILVDNKKEGLDRYEAVRTQLHSLSMWKQ